MPQNEDGDISSGEYPIPENDVIEMEAEEETESNTITGDINVFKMTRNSYAVSADYTMILFVDTK